MKMQIAYLPGGSWMLVLSECESAPADGAVERVRQQTGAIGVFTTTDPVELDGDIAFAPEGPTEAELHGVDEPPIDPQPYVDKLTDAERRAFGIPLAQFGEFKQTNIQPLIDQHKLVIKKLADAAGVPAEDLEAIKPHPVLRPEQHATMTESALLQGFELGCKGCADEIDRRRA